jgi:hypothetical protein
MLIDWVKDKRLVSPPRIGSIYPAPSSLNTMVRTLFAAAKDYYKWEFSAKDFSFDGGYNGFFEALMMERRKEDVSISLFFYLFFFQKYKLTSIQTIFNNNNNHLLLSIATLWQQVR